MVVIQEVIFDFLALVGVVSGFVAGFTFCKLYIEDKYKPSHKHILFLILGVVYMLTSVLFIFALFHVDSFSTQTPFSFWMRPLIIGMQIIPTSISWEMVKMMGHDR